MKTCSKCLQAKTDSAFNKWGRSKDGLQPWCRDCQKADAKTPASRARHARYYQANRARLDLQNKDWAKRNPEKRKAISRKHIRKAYWENPEKFRKKATDWHKANPEGGRQRAKEYRARRKNAPGKFTKTEWLDKLSEFNYHCAYCLVEFSDENPPTQDHMLPLTRGGTHTNENIVPACRGCNSQKRTRTPLEMLAM